MLYLSYFNNLILIKMKKSVCFLVIACMMALTSMAQTSFSVKVPEINQVACIEASQVNLRQGPDAKSARLMTKWLGDNEVIDFGLKTDFDGAPTPYYLEKGSIYPVIEEQGEWIRIAAPRNPWIMKKFCSLNAFGAYVLKSPSYGVPQEYELPIIKCTGKYDNLVFEVHGNEMEGNYLMIGVAIGKINYFVRNGAFGSLQLDELQPDQIKFVNEDGYYVLSYGKGIPMISAKQDEYLNCPDFSKISEKQLLISSKNSGHAKQTGPRWCFSSTTDRHRPGLLIGTHANFHTRFRTSGD